MEWYKACIFLLLDSSRWADHFGVVERQKRITNDQVTATTNWLKIGSTATWSFLTFNHIKMISSSRRVQKWKETSSILFRSDFGFYSHFLPSVATWATFGTQTQKYPQAVGTRPAYNHKLIAQNICPRKIGHHTPLPLNGGDIYPHPPVLAPLIGSIIIIIYYPLRSLDHRIQYWFAFFLGLRHLHCCCHTYI